MLLRKRKCLEKILFTLWIIKDLRLEIEKDFLEENIEPELGYYTSE